MRLGWAKEQHQSDDDSNQSTQLSAHVKTSKLEGPLRTKSNGRTGIGDLSAICFLSQSLVAPNEKMEPLAGGHHGVPSSLNNAYNKLPLITLFFDSAEKRTTVILSRPADKNLQVYFQCRIEAGTARKRSRLYYDLNGFIRENHVSLVRQNQNMTLIRIARGAMEASDEAHLEEMELIRSARLNFFHGRYGKDPGGCQTGIDTDLLREVFQVALQHRLRDDLNVLDLYCLQKASSTLSRVVESIIQERLENLHLTLTFFENGVPCRELLSFDRPQDGKIAIMIEDDKRMYLYRERPPVQVSFANVATSRPLQVQRSMDHSFSWTCHEALPIWRKVSDWVQNKNAGTLYQKLKVYWNISYGAPDSLSRLTRRAGFKHLLLAVVKIDPKQVNGALQRWYVDCRKKWNGTLLKGPLVPSNKAREEGLSFVAAIENKVEQTSNRRSYAGSLRIREIQVQFEFLVAVWVTAAKVGLLDSLRHETRPLTLHEERYKQLIEELASH